MSVRSPDIMKHLPGFEHLAGVFSKENLLWIVFYIPNPIR
jgi:hypothetical protein